MATISQIGQYRHGMYGYPVYVELAPEGAEPPVDLTGATSVTLRLQRVSDCSGGQRPAITRDLGLGSITNAGGGTTNPIIEWTVLDGDIPNKGQYEMTFTIQFGQSQRFIADGRFAVQ